MKGVSNPDGWVRLDFPGGWKEDKQNKFTQEGRSAYENEVFKWTRALANFRMHSSAITTGKMMQYVPIDAVYTYFRYDDKQTVMVVMNTSNDERTVDPGRFIERVQGFNMARDVANNTKRDLKQSWKIPGKTIWVMELAR